MKAYLYRIILIGSVGLLGCSESTPEPAAAPSTAKPVAVSGPTAADADAFISRASAEIEQLRIPYARAEWLYSNFITVDTEALAASESEKYDAAKLRLAIEAASFDQVETSPETERQLSILKRSLVIPPPSDREKATELATVMTELSSLYSTGTWCRNDDDCMDLPQMSRRMAQSRDPAELLQLWQGWREVTPPMRALYARQVELSNEGAAALGFTDVSDLWRSKYDMPGDEYALEIDRLWTQVEPLYQALHCHVRARLSAQYGSDVAQPQGLIPAHLLGNMWAQGWSNIKDMVGPEDEAAPVDLDRLLQEKDIDELQMTRIAEGFFTSLGLRDLPDTFYERSLLLKPADRKVACHASAFNLDESEDVRIKMCIERTGSDFETIHHELGHIYYYLGYNHLPWAYRYSANDGFHEAVGDTVALSITPAYLERIGLLEEEPTAGNDIGQLLGMALDKVSFLPFALLMDKWRWQVFSSEIEPEQYNQRWWELRQQYQGLKAPSARGAEAFDPGAKYHIPNNTPYLRYFMAHILQFQFHRALCEAAGEQGPLHRCSIYGNKEAGRRLGNMLALGRSQPWQDALESVTGTRQMDAGAMLDYFAPLQSWLDDQNRDRQCGW